MVSPSITLITAARFLLGGGGDASQAFDGYVRRDQADQGRRIVRGWGERERIDGLGGRIRLRGDWTESNGVFVIVGMLVVGMSASHELTFAPLLGETA